MRIGSYGKVKDNPMRGKAGAIIYHNPKCSKSRQALDLLRMQGVDTEVIEYLDTPLKKPDLVRLLSLLKMEAKAILRADPETIQLHKINVDDSESVLDAIAANPELLQRPIILYGDKAIIGRPPEKVLALFD
jgi:arsenate reductase (glutaredoxin)